MKKLCAALVVMAVVGAGVLFAWPQPQVRGGAAADPAQAAPLPGAPAQALQRPQPPAPRPQAPAQAANAALAQQQAAPAPLTELRRKQLIHRTGYYSARVARLERLRDDARAAGKTSDVAALEEALGRARSQLKLLAAAGEAGHAGATQQ